MVSLSTLNLSHCYNIQNIDSLIPCTKLQSIDFTGCHEIKDISVLESCTGINTLKFEKCILHNIDVVLKLPELKNLSISWEVTRKFENVIEQFIERK